VVSRAGGEIDFIELTCPLPELKARIDSPSRLQYGKLSDLSLFEQLYADGVFQSSHMPKARLTLDTSLCTPAQAAARIVEELQILKY